MRRIGSTARRATASCWERPCGKRSTSCSPASISAPTSATPPGTPAPSREQEAALLGLRGIALSAPATDREQPSFELLKPWAASVLEMLFDVADLPLVNVNFPAKRARRALDLPVDAALRRQGRSAKDPMGRQIYWYTVVPVESTEEASDRWAFDHGYVSITPLRLDLTDHEALERVRQLEAWKKLKVVGPGGSNRHLRLALRALARGVLPGRPRPAPRARVLRAGTSRRSRSTARSIRCSAPSTTRPGTARRRRASSSA